MEDLEKESNALIKQITEICWYMRGGVSREEAWTMSFNERQEVFKLINENIKRTKDAGMPLL